MSWSVSYLERYIAEAIALAIDKEFGVKLWACNRPIANLRPGRFRHLKVTREKVGMKVCFKNKLNCQTMFTG